jgi:hypothetical protein
MPHWAVSSKGKNMDLMFQIGERIWTSLGSVLPLVGAVVGALLGVLGTQLFQKLIRQPKPLMFIDRLKIDRSQRPPGAVTKPTEHTKKLMVDIAEHPFISEVIPVSGKMDEKEYVDCLEKAVREIDEAQDHMLDSVEKIARKLNDYINRESYEKFLKVWSEEQQIMWPLLSMIVLREERPWSDTPTSDRGDKEQLVEPPPTEASDYGEIDVDEHGDLYIHLNVSRVPPFSRSLLFPWSGRRALAEASGDPIAPVVRYIDQFRAPEKKTQKLKKLADRTAHAVSTGDQGYLRKITNLLIEAAQDYREQLHALRKRIQRELKKYDRLVVQGQISNTGGSPFSVLNDGKLFVQTAGHPYTEGREDDDRAQIYYEKDTEISVVLPNGKGRYDVPISIEPGEVYRFAAVSTLRIEQLEHYQVLLDIFSAGDKDCYLGVPVTLPGRSRKRKKPRLYSPYRLFRDWKTGLDIPRKKSLSYVLHRWLFRGLRAS